MIKYIDADKLKAEIERRIKACKTKNGFPAGTICAIRIETYEGLLSFIDSLPDENNPEPYNPVYDEGYLNEKIAKATKSWEGVDADAMLAECRGYEEKPSEDLEKAAENIYKTPFGTRAEDFQAGAEWQEKQDLGWAGEIHKNGYNLCKEQMLKDAVEVDVDDLNGEIYNNCIEKGMTGKDKVKILILKDGE